MNKVDSNPTTKKTYTKPLTGFTTCFFILLLVFIKHGLTVAYESVLKVQLKTCDLFTIGISYLNIDENSHENDFKFILILRN